MDKTLVFDIETNGLLLDVTKFWVGYTYCIETKQYTQYRTAKELTYALREATTIIGHNIINYDIPALESLTGIEITTPVVDTLILSRLAYYDKDISFSHSLEAHGERLGYPKGDHSDWTKYSEEMDIYCKRDVEVTYKLYQHLLRKTRTWLPDKALQVEQDVQKIMTQQYINGWTFDEKKAKDLHIELIYGLENAEKKLREVFKPMLIPKSPKTTIPKKPFRRNGVYTVGEHQKIELTQFNPGSGKHIVWWVEQLYGKQKWIMTDKGSPRTDADSLEKMFSDKPWAEPLLHYQQVKKILGQLAEGPNAWLKQLRNGKIHHQVNILGTNTGRATHNNPNLAQVPSPRAYKGKESRQLFIPKKGWKSVGCDLSGVELRCLAHYMARYDGGKYGEVILSGDIHTENQLAAGLPTRDNAKTFIYGFLYGAGDAKIGEIVKGTAKDGARLKKSFLTKLPALGKLVNLVKVAAKRGYLIGVTGRRLHIRSAHSALNVLLQSLGGYISKIWMIEAHKLIKRENIRCNQLGWVHDELQFECHPEDTDKLCKVLEESAVIAGEVLELRMRIDAEAQVGDTWYDVH